MESNSSGIDQQQTAVTSTPRTSSVDRGVQTERNQEKEGTRASPQGAAGEQSGIQAELEDVLRRRYIPTSRKGTPADDQKAAAIRRENWFLVLVLHVHRLALPSVTFIQYVIHAGVSWLKILFLAPAAIFLEPASILAALVIYPFIFTFLFVSLVGLYLASLVGPGYLMKLFAKWVNGHSVINWAAGDLFTSDEAQQAFVAALPALYGTPTDYPDSTALIEQGFDPKGGVRIFDVDLAKVLLLLSASAYERDENDTRLATALAVDPETAEEAKFMHQYSNYGGQTILQQWGLPHLLVWSTARLGCCVAIFWHHARASKPFIVMSFKGTTPTNFPEFLIDTHVSRVSAGVCFGDGTSHEGFMRELFPNDEHTSPRSMYHLLLMALKQVMSKITQERRSFEPLQVPLWLCGHSLGSALASLVYARLIRSPGDLPTQVELKDCYAFGTPRVGDAGFSTSLRSGLANDERNRSSLSPLSVLNNGHIGAKLKLKPTPFRTERSLCYTLQTRSFHALTQVWVTRKGARGPARFWRWEYINLPWSNPIKWLLMLVPSPVWQHFPISYWYNLDQIEPSWAGPNIVQLKDVTDSRVIKPSSQRRSA